MNDKQQLQAMGEHQAEQHMCMAKQIEDLQARLQECANGAAKMQEQRDNLAKQLETANKKIAAMAVILREVIVRGDFDREDGDSAGRLLYRIAAALAGKLPDHVAGVGNMVSEGWISVTERTPADERDVWCFGSSEADDEWHGFVGHRNTRNGEWWEHNNGDYIDGGYGNNYPARVTHWMPLPDDPKPEPTK